MKKIALLCVKTHNYGSLLQTYALQKVISNLGYDNEIISYKKTNYFKQALRLFNIPLLKQSLAKQYKNIYVKLFRKELVPVFQNRKDSFERFISELKFSPTYVGRGSLIEAANKYSEFVLGSDQVWNPMNYGADFFSMSFVPEHINKIAYAPSFGVSTIPNYQRKKTTRDLKNIDYLSVREISGQKIIKNLIGKKVEIVVDPTILLERKYWDEIKGKRIINEPYIMCYFLGNNSNHRKFAEKIKKITGIKIVTLPHLDEIVKADFGFGDIVPMDIGPKEFVNLISNASYVCTDSFHGTVFSLLYKRNFYTFDRYKLAKGDSTNSRLNSILEMTGMMSRKMDSSIKVNDKVLLEPNWEGFDERLDKFREKSMSFLKNAL